MPVCFQQQWRLTTAARRALTTGFLLLSMGITTHAQERQPGWEPGITVVPYGWLAGVKGTIGSRSDSIDTGGGLMLPPRLDVTVGDTLEEIGFMFYGEWRGERWMASFDSVWVNVSQAADIKLSRLLPASDVEATIDGNVYQANIGFFSRVSIEAGYRFLSLNYETTTYNVDLDMRGPAIGPAFHF